MNVKKTRIIKYTHNKEEEVKSSTDRLTKNINPKFAQGITTSVKMEMQSTSLITKEIMVTNNGTISNKRKGSFVIINYSVNERREKLVHSKVERAGDFIQIIWRAIRHT